MICGLVLLGSLIYPKTIYDLFEKIISLDPNSAATFEQGRIQLLNTLLLIQAAFIGVVFVTCIFVTHKIAGPIYKARLYLSQVRSGEANYPLSFRKGDHFNELADEINETVSHFKERFDDKNEYLYEVISYLDNIALVVPQDKKPVLDEIKLKLNTILNET